jgi:hypothetical protein
MECIQPSVKPLELVEREHGARTREKLDNLGNIGVAPDRSGP